MKIYNPPHDLYPIQFHAKRNFEKRNEDIKPLDTQIAKNILLKKSFVSLGQKRTAIRNISERENMKA